MAWFVKGDSRSKGNEDETYLSPAIEIIPEEQERYEELGKAAALAIMKAYYDKGNNLYDDSLMIGNPYHPYFGITNVASLMQGWRWPMFEEPLRNRLKRHEGPIVDIVDTSFETYAISQKVIDIIESIEPGVHQYLPYELIQPDGSVHSDKRWLLNVCTRADTLDYERSNVIALRDAPYFHHDKNGVRHLVVRKQAVEGRAIWFEYRYRGTHGQFLLSDRFWNALNEADCTGWQPDSLGRGEHIEEL